MSKYNKVGSGEEKHLYQHTITLSKRNNAGTWYVSYQFIDTNPNKYTSSNCPTHLCVASGRSGSNVYVYQAKGLLAYPSNGDYPEEMSTYSDTVTKIL